MRNLLLGGLAALTLSLGATVPATAVTLVGIVYFRPPSRLM